MAKKNLWNVLVDLIKASYENTPVAAWSKFCPLPSEKNLQLISVFSFKYLSVETFLSTPALAVNEETKVISVCR